MTRPSSVDCPLKIDDIIHCSLRNWRANLSNADAQCAWLALSKLYGKSVALVAAPENMVSNRSLPKIFCFHRLRMSAVWLGGCSIVLTLSDNPLS